MKKSNKLLQERFISPWAASREDEVVFERTVAMVGRLLRDDIQLQVMMMMVVVVGDYYDDYCGGL